MWADSQSANFGVRVLAEGTTNIARTAWGAGVEVDLQNFATGDSNISFGPRSIVRDIGRKNGPIKDKLNDYTVIVDTGAGDSFTDIYGLKRLFVMLYVHRVAFSLGIPVVMGPQTIGPFNTSLGRWAARRSLRTMNTVIARDPRSADYAQTLGRKVDATSTDVAFALTDRLDGDPRDIVLNISGLLWGKNHHVNSARYREEVLDLVAGLQDRGRNVSLLAHVLAPGYDEDDIHAVEQFQREYGAEFETILPTSLGQLRSTLAGANFVIGSRMHACLNALSSGTPAIAWAYSRKFAPLMNDIGWQHVIDLSNPATSPATETLHLIDSVDQAKFKESVRTVQNRAREHLNLTVSAFRTVGIAQ
ncbi:polysaccharide pyruvyl transferase [Mycobacterium sp. CBMA 213]|nr:MULTISPECIES: polysaccharide pyruvyl transferase family protein [unclassified Mycolicibacterium]MUM09146.1 polysaccharide pyruvyl transferase [Mycolicibacterium sp. CBMA 213]